MRARITLIAIFLMVISLAFIYAALAAGDRYVFSGFLLNPIDGNTYLAKMQQGMAGEWLFRLPYTADPGEGVWMLTFYLLLGHIARISGLAPILIFHLARVLFAGLMAWELSSFLRVFFPEVKTYLAALAVLLFGSGLGWVLAIFGELSSDFWIAEAYPFLSAYVNPHFPLGLALILWIFRQTMTPMRGWSSILRVVVNGVILAIVVPFGAILTGIVIACIAVWQWLESNHFSVPITIVGPICGAPVVLFQYWQTVQHPALSVWHAQNVTLTPPLWDMAVSFSPLLLLTLFALKKILRERSRIENKLLILWLAGTITIIYLPVDLQRRFLVGFYIPIGVLGLFGLERLLARLKMSRRMAYTLLFVLIIPTNLFVLLGGIGAVKEKAPILYFSADEAEAFAWLTENSPYKAVVLSGPGTGLLIPAQTGRRVIYGHPYETVFADESRAAVVDYYRSGCQQSIPERFGTADLLWIGPREAELIEGDCATCSAVFENASVRLCLMENLR